MEGSKPPEEGEPKKPEEDKPGGNEPRLEETGKNYWPDRTIKLFFSALKAYGKNYQRIQEFLTRNDPTYDKSLPAVRYYFSRIFTRACLCVRRYIDMNIRFLVPEDIDRVSAMIRPDKPRSQKATLNVVLAYGELYLAGLVTSRLKVRHYRKLYDLLATGAIFYTKNRRKYTLSIPQIAGSGEFPEFGSSGDEIPPPNDVPHNAERLMLDIRPRTMAVLLLMKQRAFPPLALLDAPVSAKVGDVVTRLTSYWRLPLDPNNHALHFYHLNETTDEKNNKTSTIRLLLESEYFVDLRSKIGGEIMILYELNYETTPNFSSGLLSSLTLSMIPKLAKTYLDVDESIHAFKKPIRPPIKLQPRIVIKEPQLTTNPDIKQTLPAKIRVNKAKPIEPVDMNKKTKRRVKTSAVAPNPPTVNIASPTVDRFSTPDFDFKIFGLNTSQTNAPQNMSVASFDDPNNNDSRFTIPWDQSNLDLFSATNPENRNIYNMDNANKNPSYNQNLFSATNMPNEDSNLGFLAHFGFYNQNQTLLSTPINPHFNPDLNEDSHPPTNYMAPEIMETPKFEKIDHKENKTPANVGRKLFFDVEE